MSAENATEFLKVSSQFRLGELSTEKSNPLTTGLSSLAVLNLPRALFVLRQVDLNMLECLRQRLEMLGTLRQAVDETLSKGNRIFLCGCGATGRLSLTLETLWRRTHSGLKKEQVIGFMAGGDVALIRSIEKFEDFPEYAHRQMEDLEFSDGDLMIAITEGGETPFVIGAAEKAAEISRNSPFFLYCNPDQVLQKIERTQKVLSNPKIKKINLDNGPQALSGSTRMQASSILMFATGLALFHHHQGIQEIRNIFQNFLKHFMEADLDQLIPFIEKETALYQNNDFLHYEASDMLGISVLTDTTERSPTFSLHPFENRADNPINPSLCYLSFPKVKSAGSAWQNLLARKPRTLEWAGLEGIACGERLLGFDFSADLGLFRKQHCQGNVHVFKINDGDHLHFELGQCRAFFPIKELTLLEVHLLLKILLNMHSTLVMGRLGRYESNIMTWVRPSNNKLIDRAVRYAGELLRQKGLTAEYKELVKLVYQLRSSLLADRPMVKEMVEQYLKNQQ